jgi:hypothetical protein
MNQYRHKQYPENEGKKYLLQEYLLRPTLVLFSIFAGMLLILIWKHEPVLIPGLIGLFVVLVVGRMLGESFAKSNFLEIGFDGYFFYMRSAWDIVNKKNLKYYPVAYANPVRNQEGISINYIDHTVKLKMADWERFEEIWASFNGQ